MSVSLVDLFDCNATIGRKAVRNPESVYEVEEFKSIMDYYGIKRALVSHGTCEDSGPFPGNEVLLSEIEGHERLVPCWVVLPNHTGELGNLRDFIRNMLNKNVKAVKIYPDRHQFSLSEWCSGELFSLLEEHHIPLLLDFNIVHYSEAKYKIRWNDIYEICKNHKNLPIILLRIGGGVNRNLFPLLGLFENLYIDISYYNVNNIIETICDRFGAHRLLFGTGLPIFSPAAPVSMLMYSAISMSEKRLIGSENLERLLESVRV